MAPAVETPQPTATSTSAFATSHSSSPTFLPVYLSSATSSPRITDVTNGSTADSDGQKNVDGADKRSQQTSRAWFASVPISADDVTFCLPPITASDGSPSMQGTSHGLSKPAESSPTTSSRLSGTTGAPPPNRNRSTDTVDCLQHKTIPISSGHSRCCDSPLRWGRPLLLVKVTLAVLLALLHLQHAQAQNGGNIAFPSGLIPLNKTWVKEMQKRRFINQVKKLLEQSQTVNFSSSSPSSSLPAGSPGSSSSLSSANSVPGVPHSESEAHKASFSPVFIFAMPSSKNLLQFQLKPYPSGTLSATAGLNLSETVTKVTLYVYIWSRTEDEEGGRQKRRRKSRKQQAIKIRVLQVDDKNRKGKRIAELRKSVEDSRWHKISLPVTLVHSVDQDNKGVIKLRVRCKRCNQKVHLIMPADAARCQKKQQRLLGASSPEAGNSNGRKRKAQLAGSKCDAAIGRQPHAPFLVIENRVGGVGYSAGASRSRRSVSSPSSSSSSSSHGYAISFTSSSSALPADSPSADPVPYYSSAQLSPVSSSSSSSSSSTAASGAEEEPFRVCHTSPRHGSCCVVSTPVDPADYGLEDSIVAPSTLFATSCEGVCSNSSSRPRSSSNNNNNSNNNNRRPRTNSHTTAAPLSDQSPSNSTSTSSSVRARRRKSRTQQMCERVESRALDVWYFDQRQELTHASLPDLVITRCGCRRQ